MKIRLAMGFALLLCFALIRPGSVFGSGSENTISQATPSAPLVLAVVRNQGTVLHDRPDGEQLQTFVGGSLVTARLRSQDNLWVLVETRDGTEGWVKVTTLLAAGLNRLPVEQPTPTPTPTPEPTSESDSAPLAEATETVTAEPESQEDAAPTASGTPEESMASTTPEPTEDSMAETTTPTLTGEAMPEPTPTEGTPEPSPTPFVPPAGPSALSLARIGGANLWRNEDGAFVAHFGAGKRLTAIYRTEDSDYYFVHDNDGVHGWVLAEELLVIGGSSLPIEEFPANPTSETEIASDEAMEKTATPTPTPTPTPTMTPTVGPLRIVVTVNNIGQRLNVRAGPGTEHEIVAKAVAGVTFNAIGRNEESSWIQVTVADLPSGIGWVSAEFVTVDGPLDQLSVVEETDAIEEGNSPPPPVFSLPLAFHPAKPSTTTIA
jgi:hypothetical protein